MQPEVSYQLELNLSEDTGSHSEATIFTGQAM